VTTVRLVQHVLHGHPHARRTCAVVCEAGVWYLVLRGTKRLTKWELESQDELIRAQSAVARITAELRDRLPTRGVKG
jgi:hypothetical protein